MPRFDLSPYPYLGGMGKTHLVMEDGSSQDNKDTWFITIWVFPKRGVYTPKWMVKIMENPIKMDDLGVPPFAESPI